MLSRAPEAQAARQTRPLRTSRLAGVGAALAMALAVSGALYVSDAAFAARVNQMAGVAQAHAAELVDTIKARVARES